MWRSSAYKYIQLTTQQQLAYSFLYPTYTNADSIDHLHRHISHQCKITCISYFLSYLDLAIRQHNIHHLPSVHLALPSIHAESQSRSARVRRPPATTHPITQKTHITLVNNQTKTQRKEFRRNTVKKKTQKCICFVCS